MSAGLRRAGSPDHAVLPLLHESLQLTSVGGIHDGRRVLGADDLPSTPAAGHTPAVHPMLAARAAVVEDELESAGVGRIGQQFKWNIIYPGPDGKLGKYLLYPKPYDPKWPVGKDGKDVASLGYHGYESFGNVLEAWETKGGLGSCAARACKR